MNSLRANPTHRRWQARLALLALIALAGCGETPWAGVVEFLTPPPPLLAQGPLTGPGLRLDLEGRSRGTAELLQELGERRLWRTPGGLVVATDGARVVATTGLPQVLAATRFDGPDPLADPLALLERPAAARRLVDLMGAGRDPADMRFGLAVECRLTARDAPEDQAVLVQERCRAKGVLGGFVNRFWVDPASATIYRSEQWVGPGVPMLGVTPVAPDATPVLPVVNPAN